eukprot:12689717-Ditylum_brightwellii.AAC.1
MMMLNVQTHIHPYYHRKYRIVESPMKQERYCVRLGQSAHYWQQQRTAYQICREIHRLRWQH